jgi:60 kDa SS-A/Ro ribonucleoprotein
LTVLDLSARRRLDDNIREITGLPLGRTDCALPMLYALEKGLEIDSFSVFTDSETWLGAFTRTRLWKRYRKETV